MPRNNCEGKYFHPPGTLSSALLSQPAWTPGRLKLENAHQEDTFCCYLSLPCFSRAYFLVNLFFGLRSIHTEPYVLVVVIEKATSPARCRGLCTIPMVHAMLLSCQ